MYYTFYYSNRLSFFTHSRIIIFCLCESCKSKEVRLMQNNINYREIVQTVTQQVTANIVKQLGDMKPDVEQEIADAVFKTVDSIIYPKIQSLESRIANLQSQLSKNDTSSLQRQLNDLQTRISNLERQIASSGNNNSSYSNPVTPVPSSSNQTLLDKIRFWQHKNYNGWIIYVNENQADFLYKIREDGSQNTQLTDYSVSLIKGIKSGMFSSTLEIVDSNYQHHTIKI